MMQDAHKLPDMADFLRVYFAELGSGVTGRVAYNRSESWFFAQAGRKRFSTYESFRTVKSRYLHHNRHMLTASPRVTRQDVFNAALSLIPIEVSQKLKEQWEQCQ